MRIDARGQSKSIDWGATGHAAIIQNIEFVLSTNNNTLFLDRELGRESHFDVNINEANVLEAGEIATLIASNFEGVEIENIDFESNGSTLIPQIKVVFEENG